MKRVAVIGLGYVGLPLALLAGQKGFKVSGIDVNESRIKSLQEKICPIKEEVLEAQLKDSDAEFSTSFELIKEADIVIVCVPTPVSADKIPDLTPVKTAVESVAKHIKKDSLLVIESTINPGVCEDVVIPLLESISGYSSGQDIFVAHCPERINPGDATWDVSNIARVVGADSARGLELAAAFYRQLVDAEIKEMATIKEAEAVKVVENSFRDINIAFVNELAMSFSALGINVKNVIDGAATKPFAFMAHYPGIGVGGHCIPVDPYYLIEYAKHRGFEHRFLSLARSINETMPSYSVDTLEKILQQKLNKSLAGAKVAVLGLSYKPNVADDRESPSYAVIDILKARGAAVRVFDPYFPGKSDAPSAAKALKGQDAAILVVAHQEFLELSADDYSGLSVLLDGRNALVDRAKEFTEQGITYLGIGVSN